MLGSVYVSKSVDIGKIDSILKTETDRRKIRDEYLRDSSVTVVLVVRDTWQRKYVDWEISSSIQYTQFNPRSGLIGIILPTHSDYRRDEYNRYLIPPRLYNNLKCSFAKIYDWTNNITSIQN